MLDARISNNSTAGNRPNEYVALVETTRYGTIYSIRASLRGPNGNSLSVCAIWMIEQETEIAKFITMYPDKGPRRDEI